jgi:hypothetical protein
VQGRLNRTWADSAAIRGCADDIGAAFSSFKFLSLVAPIFHLAQGAAGLTLKAAKCVIIPLSAPTEVMEPIIRKWLKSCLPAWSQFVVRDWGKYLGVVVGPGGLERSWDDAVQK